MRLAVAHKEAGATDLAGKPRPDGRGLAGVIGIRADADDVIWILDMGDAGHQPKLIGWNDRENRLHPPIKPAVNWAGGRRIAP
jgi:hypothetical protein